MEKKIMNSKKNLTIYSEVIKLTQLQNKLSKILSSYKAIWWEHFFTWSWLIQIENLKINHNPGDCRAPERYRLTIEKTSIEIHHHWRKAPKEMNWQKKFDIVKCQEFIKKIISILLKNRNSDYLKSLLKFDGYETVCPKSGLNVFICKNLSNYIWAYDTIEKTSCGGYKIYNSHYKKNNILDSNLEYLI